MKRVTDFIVDKRYLVLGFFLILTLICGFLSNNVKINHDIAKYLPKTSEVRRGMDIMESEFESKTSTLNVMLEDLDTKEKEDAKKYLENLKYVNTVEHAPTKKYNKKNYSLYILEVEGEADSKEAKQVYKKVEKHFRENLTDTSGTVSDHNKTVLPFYIVVLAVLSALVILIIMSSSYIEPFLFLATILIAVVLNNGTNIIFHDVSNITNSICAILQMALSMDYSIMLINRYRQEKSHEKNKIKAMKKALLHAFSAISSSSVTTIVGLLALVFMSFTIGRDLGFVLAKGVLLSLLSIFTCLPALILMFDKLIDKTKKKSPIIKLNYAGIISYKLRHIGLITFVLIFVISYFLKGNLGIVYTESGSNEIDKVFKLNNQIAVIYKNKDENKIKDYCKKIEKDKRVDDVLCYSNTLNQDLKYNKLNKKFKDLGVDTEIDDYLVKLIYYHYYNPKENNKMTLNNLVNFVTAKVYKNKEMSKNIDSDTRNNIERIKKFTSKDEINKKRSISEISNILNIDESSLHDLLIYYNRNTNTNTSLTINEFINFMKTKVLPNPKYNTSIDNNTINNLNMIETFINKNTITKKMSSTDISNIFGMNKSMVDNLYTYYLSGVAINDTLSVNEFSNILLNDVIPNPTYSNMFTEDSKAKIKLMNTFSNITIINKEMNYKEIANILSLNENDSKNLYLLIFGNHDNGRKLTIKDFVDKVKMLKETPYLQGQNVDELLALEQTPLIANPTEYSATELAKVLGKQENAFYQLYALTYILDGKDIEWTLTPYNFINTILSNAPIKGAIDENNINNLQTLKVIMDSALSNTKYTYTDISGLFSLDINTTKSIYALALKDRVAMSPYEFVDFILTHQNDTTLKNNLTNEMKNKLNLVKTIMDSTLTNKRYNKESMSSLLGVDVNKLSLLYSLYDVEVTNKNIELSLKEFVNFILNDVLNNSEYNKSFTEETKTKLVILNEIMNDSLNNKKYTKEKTYNTLSQLADNLDKNLIDLVYIYYGSENDYNKKYTLTIEKFINYLNNNILLDSRFDDFISSSKRNEITDAKKLIKNSKKLLVGDKYSRIVINTSLEPEGKDTFNFIKKLKNNKDVYVIGDSPMAYEMSKTFQDELNLITVLTMIFIFVVVAVTFKSILIPLILVLLIQTAVYLTMGILSFTGTVYFISILIVQSILMGATIDYAILYTSYYLEERKTLDIKKAIINSYNKSIHTIVTSASILIIVTLIVGCFSSAIAAKICTTISEGTLASSILILVLLPAVIASVDKFVVKRNKK